MSGEETKDEVIHKVPLARIMPDYLAESSSAIMQSDAITGSNHSTDRVRVQVEPSTEVASKARPRLHRLGETQLSSCKER